MMQRVVATALLLAGTWANACGGGCLPGGPSGSTVQFNGTIEGGGLVFHDVSVPSDTDSVTVGVQWGPRGADVRLTQIDPNCDPTQNSTGQRLTDQQGPAPITSQTIAGYLSHQGPRATGRVRFILENRTPGVVASYTATATPQRHGCDR
jgi:hypothetical protein